VVPSFFVEETVSTVEEYALRSRPPLKVNCV